MLLNTVWFTYGVCSSWLKRHAVFVCLFVCAFQHYLEFLFLILNYLQCHQFLKEKQSTFTKDIQDKNTAPKLLIRRKSFTCVLLTQFKNKKFCVVQCMHWSVFTIILPSSAQDIYIWHQRWNNITRTFSMYHCSDLKSNFRTYM